MRTRTRTRIRIRTRLLLFLPLLLSTHAYAQPWAGVVDPSRATSNWTTSGVSGGIPTTRTQCGSTIAAGASAATINAAIAACAANHFVLLGAGAFTLTNTLTMKSNVTLRGSGANSTIITWSSPGSGCQGLGAAICIASVDQNYQANVSNSATWSAGYTQGGSSLTLSSTTNLVVGNPIILDQIDDLNDTNSNLIYVCEESATIRPAQNPPCNDDAGGTGGDSGAQRGTGTTSPRGQMEVQTVTSIVGSAVGISPGLYMPNWRTGQTPGAWWATSPISGVGIENLSITYAIGQVDGMFFFNAYNSWVKGVRSSNPGRAHVSTWLCSRITVRDSYFYATQAAASESYGFEAYPCQDCLVENNIYQQVTGPVVLNASCSGCVIGYNFAVDNYFSQSLTFLSQSQYQHAGGTDFILFEGNAGAGAYLDLFHGTHHFGTLFRNRYNGFEPNMGTITSSHTNAVILYPFARYFNVIGNVLGTSGYHTQYECLQSSCSAPDQSVYIIGTGTAACCLTGDPNVQATLMLWGNYDTVNAANRFVSGEVPSGIAFFANPVPASNTLPPSFYYTSKPAWWPTAKVWPPIGPDVTGGNVANVGGHANTIPAQDCYLNVMGGPTNGTGAILPFDASTCYTNSVGGSVRGGPRVSAGPTSSQ